MDKKRKRTIKRLWRQRLLVAIGGVAALGFSVLQLQAVLRHRSPQPSWTLDLSKSVETVVDEKSSEQEQENALLEIQAIAQKRGLSVTADRDRDLDLALDRALALALDRALDRARARDLDLDRALDRALDLDLDLDRALDRARDLALALALDLARARDLDRDLARALDLALALAWDLFQYLDQEGIKVDVSKAQALSQELVQTLEQAQAKLEGPLIVLIVSSDLKKEYEFQLYQGNTLDTLVSKEPNRARNFLTSAVLLTTSLFVLMALIVVLSKLQLSYGLAPNSHLIAFLPEECAAELGALKRRMKKKNASVWHIRLRLLQEFLMLLWVFYIQVQMDNLGLPPSDRSTDD